MKLALAAAVVVAAAAALAPAARADGDPEAGKNKFKICTICHSIDPAKKAIGPTLFGVFGRKSAAVEDYAYSDALKAADKTWDAETLDAWLASPKTLVPGTKMVFPGLPKPEDRANVIAYLATLK